MRSIICTPISFPALMTSLLLLILYVFAPAAEAGTRIKDIARINTENEIDLLGYGLIIGLDGTGDGKGSQFTMQSLANMMERMGMTVDVNKLKVKNVAAVIATARLSSNYKMGDRIDVTVSSIGDASSLQGGTLLMTPLAAADGEVYATAQGPVSIGGFNVQVDEANKIINNYTLVGRVPNGAKVNRQLGGKSNKNDVLITLRTPDYATATAITQTINLKYGLTAYTEDAATVRVIVPDSLAYANERGNFIADIGRMTVNPDQTARVVVNERTGTIVAGQNVSIAPVAIAHGNINVSIKSSPVISQPEPFSQGETVVAAEYQLDVDSDKARVIHFEETVSLADIASALNSIGATPRDIVAIFEALKQAGALRAELIII
ncbi:MAG: flagellar basal body P-ring protein FlgI [Candidatus Zixiibacteriota bacterium]|nr:MAG: flagellar basal body P-ring protein FlgI [candidate division Zixibacteria bacterium]